MLPMMIFGLCSLLGSMATFWLPETAGRALPQARVSQAVNAIFKNYFCLVFSGHLLAAGNSWTGIATGTCFWNWHCHFKYSATGSAILNMLGHWQRHFETNEKQLIFLSVLVIKREKIRQKFIVARPNAATFFKSPTKFEIRLLFNLDAGGRTDFRPGPVHLELWSLYGKGPVHLELWSLYGKWPVRWEVRGREPK